MASKAKHVRPKNKNFLSMELPRFEALKEAQAHAKLGYDAGNNLLLIGYPGTGKSHIALHFALEEIERGTKERIHIFRSAVSGRDIGFLPGTEEEKMRVYEPVYRKITNRIFDRDDAYDYLKLRKVLTFNSTSYLRGHTFEDCVVIVDECQNMNHQEIHTLMTRIGKNCRIILCGDGKQSDLKPGQSAFQFLCRAFKLIGERVTIVQFEIDDIVRDDFVKLWIIAVEKLENESAC